MSGKYGEPMSAKRERWVAEGRCRNCGAPGPHYTAECELSRKCARCRGRGTSAAKAAKVDDADLRRWIRERIAAGWTRARTEQHLRVALNQEFRAVVLAREQPSVEAVSSPTRPEGHEPSEAWRTYLRDLMKLTPTPLVMSAMRQARKVLSGKVPSPRKPADVQESLLGRVHIGPGRPERNAARGRDSTSSDHPRVGGERLAPETRAQVTPCGGGWQPCASRYPVVTDIDATAPLAWDAEDWTQRY